MEDRKPMLAYVVEYKEKKCGIFEMPGEQKVPDVEHQRALMTKERLITLLQDRKYYVSSAKSVNTDQFMEHWKPEDYENELYIN